MICVYCKERGAVRGEDGIALCESCDARFTEGPTPSARQIVPHDDDDWDFRE
jgi:ribosomal protein L37AE/L43A